MASIVRFSSIILCILLTGCRIFGGTKEDNSAKVLTTPTEKRTFPHVNKLYRNLQTLSAEKKVKEFEKLRLEVVQILLYIGNESLGKVEKTKNILELQKASLAFLNTLKLSGDYNEKDDEEFKGLMFQSNQLLDKFDFSKKSKEFKNTYPFLTWAWKHGLETEYQKCQIHPRQKKCDSASRHETGSTWNYCKVLIPPLWFYTVPETVVCGVFDLILGWDTVTEELKISKLDEVYTSQARRALRKLNYLNKDISKIIPTSENLKVDITVRVGGYNGNPGRLNRHIELVKYRQLVFGKLPYSKKEISDYLLEFERDLNQKNGRIFSTSKTLSVRASKDGSAMIQTIKLRGIIPLPEVGNEQELDEFIEKYSFSKSDENIYFEMKAKFSFESVKKKTGHE